jgi:hypothetical protein
VGPPAVFGRSCRVAVGVAVSHGESVDNNEGVATWADFEREAPDLAAVGERVWPGLLALSRNKRLPPGVAWFAVAYLATVRRDGAPRLPPFCPVLAGGRLFGATPRSSPKGWDLRREPRCVSHAMPGPEDDELCLTALANEVTEDAATTGLVRGVVARTGVGGIEATSRDPLFEFGLREVNVARWINIGQRATYADRHEWRAP